MALPKGFLTALARQTDIEVLTEPGDCWPYGYDNSRRQVLPDAVAFATTVQQVQSVLQLCNQYQVPVVPRGRGTGTPGGAVPLYHGLVLSLERMNRIIEVNSDNRYLIAEPGATNAEIQAAAGAYGFFWPPDPTSANYCSLGGNLAYNSAGPRAVKYGTPRENTLGLQAVTGRGERLRTGVYTTKGVVGYDLTRLLIGSEGTLAIITQATLKLTALPEAKCTLLASYVDIQAATQAVAAIMSQPLVPCAVEFMDQQAIQMVREYAPLPLAETVGACLIIEVDGDKDSITMIAHRVAAVAKVTGVIQVMVADNAAKAQALWRTRKALSPALRRVAPKKINEDVVVPVANIPALLAGLQQLSQEFKITIVNFGHAGNGNIHVNLLIDPEQPQELQRANECLNQIFDLVLALKGTLSGEHGIGFEKRNYINRELDPVSLRLMRDIKAQFDPQGILNPGKIFSESL